jgi:hypothetical protein
MASDNMKRTDTIRIELTEAQRRRIADVLGEARAASETLALELTVEELEQRITPRVAYN